MQELVYYAALIAPHPGTEVAVDASQSTERVRRTPDGAGGVTSQTFTARTQMWPARSRRSFSGRERPATHGTSSRMQSQHADDQPPGDSAGNSSRAAVFLVASTSAYSLESRVQDTHSLKLDRPGRAYAMAATACRKTPLLVVGRIS